MATQDISRFLLQPQKHYSSLHLQQGRVIVDSDWNERASIEAEDLRQTLLDIVCARGTPNDGFEVSDVATIAEEIALPGGGTHNTYDFEISGGSYYLGGLRLAIDGAAGNETFLGQSDWLQVTSLAAYMPLVPPVADRNDLVYVYAWEQPVTAVEDSELAEAALGGRDTSTRIKRMRRLVVEAGVDSDPDLAFSNLMTALEESGKATYDSNTGELVSQGRLRVQAALEPMVEDPCAEPTASGYVGANNQTIRVELRPGVEATYDGKLIWGYDNASKLYRVQVNGTNVKILTPPSDISSIPRKGQIVELLQWGAKLPNGEKVAEAQGLLTVVTTTYNPSSGDLEIEVDAALTLELNSWNAWLDDHDEHYNPKDSTDVQKYLYMRIWDRGSEVATSIADALVNYRFDEAVGLGDTGLEVMITDAGKDGDYWIIAARPSTPDVVTPWSLSDTSGAPPHGPRRFYAPLAQISVDDAPVSYQIQDLRTHLRQLCEGGACTVTVGDGKHSFGHFKTLQEAVAVVGNGSKICVLPGEYEGQTVIEDFEGLVIEGCGFRSVLKNAQPTATNTDFTAFDPPVITIRDSSNVFIRDLTIVGYSAVGVAIEKDNGTCKRIALENLRIGSTGGYTTDATGSPVSWWLPASCVTVAAASQVEIVDCEMAMANVLSFAFAVVLGGDALSMRGCTVEAPAEVLSVALGGINIRSGSRDVEIIDCDIRGGWGHGIALGHGRVFTAAEQPTAEEVMKDKVTAGTSESAVGEGEDPSGCACEGDDRVIIGNTAEQNPLFLPAGAVEDVRIYDNRISEMGLSGVSTSLYWPSTIDYGTVTGSPVFIVVTDIDIARNVIEDNVRFPLGAAMFVNYDVCVGGVCLAASANAWVHENTIRNNGKIHRHIPTCGVGMVAAMNAVIEDNQIVDNGVLPTGTADFQQPGLRGGIAIYEATAIRTKAKTVGAGRMPSFPTNNGSEYPYEGSKNWLGLSSQAAVTVRGNEVSQPFGRALWIARGFGPIVVTGNTLQSYGSPVLNDGVPGTTLRWIFSDGPNDTNNALTYEHAGACVEISNYGLSEDKPFPSDPIPTFPAIAFVDPGQDEIYGGTVLVSGNRMRLDWERKGGWPASVVVQSLGSVVFNDNSSEVTMANSFTPTTEEEQEEEWEFATTVCFAAFDYTFVLTNVYVGARAGVTLSGNRLTEPRWDAVFSAIVGFPGFVTDQNLVTPMQASIATSNIGSHCIVAPISVGTGVKTDNIEAYQLQRIVVGVATYNCDSFAVLTSPASSISRVVAVGISIPGA